MQWVVTVTIACAGCGRIGFDALGVGGDAPAAGDAPAGMLVGWWKLDETSGTVAHDSSGHGHDGTVSANDTWTTGEIGGALLIGNGPNDGSDEVDVGDAAELEPTGSMTIAAWVDARSFHLADVADDIIVSHFDVFATEVTGWKLDGTEDCDGAQHFGIYVSIASGVFAERCSTTAPALDTWYHVAGVYDAGAQELHIYVNGALDDGILTNTVPAVQAEPTNAIEVLLGHDTETPSGFSLDGTLDDVRIYLGALDAGAIAQLATP